MKKNIKIYLGITNALDDDDNFTTVKLKDEMGLNRK